MGKEEGEEIKIKCIENLFNRIVAKNFPSQERESCPGAGSLKNTKLSGPKKKYLQTNHNQILSTQNKERILKAVKEKRLVTFKGKPI
jgi:hypothetical protein